MPKPTSSLATLRPDIAGSLEEFDLQANMLGFVGLLIAPVFEAVKSSGKFGRIPLEQILQTKNTRRAPGGAYNRGDWKFEDDSFETEEHGWEEPVDDREAAIYADYFDAEVISAVRARNVVLEAHERRVIDIVNAVANTNAAGTAWTDTASATPITNVRAALEALYGRIGGVVSRVEGVISWKRFQYLRDNAQIIDRIKSNGETSVQRGNINAQMIANALGINRLHIAGSVKNTANQQQTASLGSLFSDTKFLLFVPPASNDIRQPCFMRTIHWGEDGSQIGGVIETYRDESVRSDIVRNRMDTDEKVMYDAAAQVITGI
jgi:hypothetical protein